MVWFSEKASFVKDPSLSVLVGLSGCSGFIKDPSSSVFVGLSSCSGLETVFDTLFEFAGAALSLFLDSIAWSFFMNGNSIEDRSSSMLVESLLLESFCAVF